MTTQRHPEMYESIIKVPFAKWYEDGIRFICLDVDATITDFNGGSVDPPLLPMLHEAASYGLEFAFVTNNMHRIRLKRMQKEIGPSLKYIFHQQFLFDRKPSPRMFHKALKASGLPPEKVAMIGDSYRNDIEPTLRLGFGRVAWVRGYKKSLWTRLFLQRGEDKLWNKLWARTKTAKSTKR